MKSHAGLLEVEVCIVGQRLHQRGHVVNDVQVPRVVLGDLVLCACVMCVFLQCEQTSDEELSDFLSTLLFAAATLDCLTPLNSSLTLACVPCARLTCQCISLYKGKCALALQHSRLSALTCHQLDSAVQHRMDLLRGVRSDGGTGGTRRGSVC